MRRADASHAAALRGAGRSLSKGACGGATSPLGLTVLADVLRLASVTPPLRAPGRRRRAHGSAVLLRARCRARRRRRRLAAGLAGAARSREPELASGQHCRRRAQRRHPLPQRAVGVPGRGGGLVYIKSVAGVAHVFVSRLAAGIFQPPVQVDAGLAGPSSQPVIAAGQGGLVLVAFINAGTLYVAQAADVGHAAGGPVALFGGGGQPLAGDDQLGQGLSGLHGHRRRRRGRAAAYYLQGGGAWCRPPWTSGSVDGRASARDARTSPRPGTAWGSSPGARRATSTRGASSATTASTVYRAGRSRRPSTDGRDVGRRPTIASGGDSTLRGGGLPGDLDQRLGRPNRGSLMDHLHGAQFDPVAAADGIDPGGPEGADQPQTAVTEYGGGWVTSGDAQTHMLFATKLGGARSRGAGRAPGHPRPTRSPPDAVPASRRVYLEPDRVAADTGLERAVPEIRLRYAPDGSTSTPRRSSPRPRSAPPTPTSGLAAAGDVAGDAAVAWVQGSGASTRIVAAQLFQAPGASSRDLRSPTPVRSTTRHPGRCARLRVWGRPPTSSTSTAPGRDQTTATQHGHARRAAQGRTRYQVGATNRAGLTSSSRARHGVRGHRAAAR